jgi:hypothetical protein
VLSSGAWLGRSALCGVALTAVSLRPRCAGGAVCAGVRARRGPAGRLGSHRRQAPTLARRARAGRHAALARSAQRRRRLRGRRTGAAPERRRGRAARGLPRRRLPAGAPHATQQARRLLGLSPTCPPARRLAAQTLGSPAPRARPAPDSCCAASSAVPPRCLLRARLAPCRCPQRPLCAATAPAVEPPAPAPAASTATPPARSRLLVAQHDTLDVWQLADAAPPPSPAAPSSRGATAQPGRPLPLLSAPPGPAEGEALELRAGPRHLARLKVKGGRVAAAGLAPSGGFVVVATPAGGRAYAVQVSCHAPLDESPQHVTCAVTARPSGQPLPAVSQDLPSRRRRHGVTALPSPCGPPIALLPS